MLEMTPGEIEQHLAESRIGRLCMATPDGEPYVVPMPFCWLEHALYLRVALKGRKGIILSANPRVCFEIDWFSDTLDDYGSILIEGRLEPVASLPEKSRVKSLNEHKYARLRKGFRPGHGRQTPLEDLPLQKIVVTRLSGRKRENPTTPAPLPAPAP
ncbi:MAG: pyridoxamine 5'-phosphate oxidase family protein [Phycisphaerae bacterium]